MAMTDGAYEFHLDLLTSFDARPPGGGGGVVSMDDGVRTFRRMVADGSVGGPGIVRVTLRLDVDTVVVTDAASGDEIDRFPFSMMGQVSEVVSERSSAPFHNVLTFTVLEDAFQMAPPEMYFFQCHDMPVISLSVGLYFHLIIIII